MHTHDELFLNQVAQAILAAKAGEEWFSALPIDRQQETLRWISNMSIQAGARMGDAPAAIQQSGLKPTHTPCVLLSRENLSVQLAKIVNLPPNEFLKAFKLLMALFRIADSRRRETQCANGCLHWWHRDLSNSKVVEDIQLAGVEHARY
ncbi:MAG TPA: DUF5958 family protein [Gemmataceae bacterium]|nr:DUF5958 family protein [Gemmataceae bacterium]